MTNLLRAVLLSLLCLMVFATSAAAECACVLWQAPSGWREWLGWRSSPVRAFESHRDCDEMQTAFNLVRTTAVDRQTVENLTVLGYKTEMSYHCLPDTVDPRGPKGSGR